MSGIVNFSIDVEKLPKELLVKGKKGTYINLTMFLQDETRYGNNASIQLPKSKEEREQGKDSVYVGNGKVVWLSDDGVTLAEREDANDGSDSIHPDSEEDDLPF